jgi:hypothetical protein
MGMSYLGLIKKYAREGAFGSDPVRGLFYYIERKSCPPG